MKFMLIFVAIFAFIITDIESQLVQTQLGKIQGFNKQLDYGLSIDIFQGIRYGKFSIFFSHEITMFSEINSKSPDRRESFQETSSG